MVTHSPSRGEVGALEGATVVAANLVASTAVHHDRLTGSDIVTHLKGDIGRNSVRHGSLRELCCEFVAGSDENRESEKGREGEE